jgi:hypothetical protein
VIGVSRRENMKYSNDFDSNYSVVIDQVSFVPQSYIRTRVAHSIDARDGREDPRDEGHQLTRAPTCAFTHANEEIDNNRSLSLS